MSWISSTNPCRAFAQLCFCPPLLFTSKTPSNLWFLFLKHIAARRPNKFHKMCFSWGSLACGLLPIPSKAEQSLRDLHFNPIFSRLKNGWGFKNNQTIKKTNNQITLLRVTPTMTFIHLYVLLLAYLQAFYLTYLLAFYLTYHSGTSIWQIILALLSGISSGILSGKHSGTLSGISIWDSI